MSRKEDDDIIYFIAEDDPESYQPNLMHDVVLPIMLTVISLAALLQIVYVLVTLGNLWSQ